MDRFVYRRWQHQDLSLLGHELSRLAGQPSLRVRVPRPPFVPAHSIAALEAKVHALVERAAAFAPPAMAIPDYHPFPDLLPDLPGVQPF